GQNVPPGRYAAIDVGTNSVLVLVADVDFHGTLAPVVEKSRITRLGENVLASKALSQPAMHRTLQTIVEYVAAARHAGAEHLAIVGTAVLRDAENAADFCRVVRVQCGLPVEVITGEQEAELAWRAQQAHPALRERPGPRVVLDIGGGSTEVVQGQGAELDSRASFP